MYDYSKDQKLTMNYRTKNEIHLEYTCMSIMVSPCINLTYIIENSKRGTNPDGSVKIRLQQAKILRFGPSKCCPRCSISPEQTSLLSPALPELFFAMASPVTGRSCLLLELVLLAGSGAAASCLHRLLLLLVRAAASCLHRLLMLLVGVLPAAGVAVQLPPSPEKEEKKR